MPWLRVLIVILIVILIGLLFSFSQIVMMIKRTSHGITKLQHPTSKRQDLFNGVRPSSVAAMSPCTVASK